VAASFNATTALSGAFAPLAAYPFTLACWFNAREAASGHGLFGLGNPAGDSTNYIALRAAGDTAGDPLRYIIADNVGGFAGVNTTTSFQANAWQHAAVVSASPTSHSVYLNGGGKATSATGVNFPSVSKFSVGALDRATLSLFCNGSIAVPAIWNAALTDAEVAALAAGTHPTLIRPGSLVEAWPLLPHERRQAAGSRRGLVLNTTSADLHSAADPAAIAAPRPPGVHQLHEASPRAARHGLDWLARVLAAGPSGPRRVRWYPGLGSARRRR